MAGLDFKDFDCFLRKHNGRIIHQVWFGTIPNKHEAKKTYKKFKLYRDSWKLHNPTWYHIEWNKKMCRDLVTKIFPEYLETYVKYKYEIQRCDVVRYLILCRYGGLYADMDYYCNRPFDEALKQYTHDIYFVQSPNSVIGQDTDHISNSLMYSRPDHSFWKQVMTEIAKNASVPYYYTKHITVMYTTGPAILNKIYSKYKSRYKVRSLPYKLFHPFGIGDDKKSLKSNKEIFTIHIGKGSWEKNDSKFFLVILKKWKVILSIILVMFLPILLYSLFSKLSKKN